MSFIDRVIGIVTKPDVTTKDIAGDPRIEEGVLLVGVYTILMIVSTFISMSRVHPIGSTQGMDASTVSTLLLVTGVLGSIFVGLAGWPFVAGACHVLSLFFGGQGKFYPGLMTLIGYTCIPLIITTIPVIALTFAMPVVTMDLGQGSQMANNVMASPIWILSSVVSLAGAVWTAFVMAFTVKNGEKIGMKQALVVVGLLFIANLAYSFGPIIAALI